MGKEDNGIFGDEKSAVNVRELLLRYVVYWPLFVVSIFICVGIAVLYSKYTVRKYIANTAFLVKGSGNANGGSGDLIETALKSKSEFNLNNELLILKSSTIMQRTVAKNGLNVYYYKKGRILNVELYKDAPFSLTAKELTDSNSTYEIYIKQIDNTGGFILYGPKQKEQQFSFKWNQPFKMSGQTFILSPTGLIQKGDGEYIVQWRPVPSAAGELLNNLFAGIHDTKTSVIELSIKTENLEKGKDVLNEFFAEYNLSDIEDRNKLSRSTVQFIDDRLVRITGELQGVEGNLENYKGSNQLIDIGSQSAQSLSNSNNVSQTIKDLAIEQSVVAMLFEYFENPDNGNKLVPSSLGLNDPTLGALIAQYNDLQLKKERVAPDVAVNSTVMQDLNTQMTNLKSSIIESLNNISKNFKLRERSFQKQNNQYQTVLSSVPHNERVMQEIKRKQSITEGLYLYLLQKREEAAISSTTSTVSNFKQLDPATGYGPVEPNTNNLIMYAGILGFFAAFASIFIKDLLNDKITSKEDIIKRTSLLLLGQIAHQPKRKKQFIAVLDRNVIGEQFRAIRTNISFMLKDKNKKIILVTSSAVSEGKSFISINLAAVFAMPDKKVALLEFDIRKPGITSNLNINATKGLTDYLKGQVQHISEIRKVADEIPGLHIFPSGPIPANPADLLLSGNMRRLFEALKAEYDYIIIDSPPVGLVSDAYIFAEYCEMVLYVIRHQKTTKRQVEFLNEIVGNKALSNVSLILNDIKKGDNYGYGYGGDYYGSSNGAEKKPFRLVR